LASNNLCGEIAAVRINQLLSRTSAPTTGIGVPGQAANQFAGRQAGFLQSGQFISSDGILIAACASTRAGPNSNASCTA